MDTGEVTSIVGDQVVVKCVGKPPLIGSPVHTRKGRIGIVSDVIGAVSEPYFTVKLLPKAKIQVSEKTISG